MLDSGSIQTMIDQEMDQGGISSNLSLSDLTKSSNSFLMKDNTMIEKSSEGNGIDEYGQFKSIPDGNSSQCSINITLFNSYIKSKSAYFNLF